MFMKTSGSVLATCSCLHLLPVNASISSTSSHSKYLQGIRPQACPSQNRRLYASVVDDSDISSNARNRTRNAGHDWPRPPDGQPYPTPYQIFSLKEGAPYSKARFYELVKVYHPDISSSSCGADVPHAVKVERYRLIVAAHSILSDPAKRSAYDRLGAGWNGKAENGAWNAGSSSSNNAPGPFTHSWTDPGDPIWRNATWEDWERFYARRAQENGNAEYPPKRAPVFMANSYFLACLVALAIAGSSLNYGRAQDAGTYFVEQRDIVHDRAAKDLRRVRQEKLASSREDRIEYFVRQREATMGVYSGDVDALQEERASRMLPEKEVCRSEHVKDSET